MSKVAGYRFLAFLALTLMVWSNAPTASATPLDDYIAAPDSNYRWEIVNSRRGSMNGVAYTDYIVYMISQQWLTAAEINKPIWHHYMMITVPDVIDHSTAFMFITGGNVFSGPPSGNDGLAIHMATTTHTVVASLKQIPNEPMTFTGYRQETEDGLIAYGWRKFLEGGDPIWLMRLPMTKACVRAMDTITALMAGENGGGQTVDKFVVCGGSKRGWTTWTTAAADPRIVAAAPVVIDLLNMGPSFRHHWDAYGFYSPAVWDYIENRIFDWLDTPQMEALVSVVEPYEYRDRLTMPKLIVAASGDEFFIPDSSQFYFDRLRGENHMLYVPNSGHGVENNDGSAELTLMNGLLSWYHAVLNNVARPEVTWYKRADGALVIDTHGNTPIDAELWVATNPDRRCFIHEVYGDNYESEPLNEDSPGHYVATVELPEKGWRAFYAMFKFDSGLENVPFVFTTEISIVPDVLPFGPQRSLGPSEAMLSESFYIDGGATPVRHALRPSLSGNERNTAFWGAHSQNGTTGLFIVPSGRPAEWRRLTADAVMPSTQPIVWSPDDSAVLFGQKRMPVPPLGQLGTPQDITLHGFAANIATATKLYTNNWAAAVVDNEIAMLPILPDGTEDLTRDPVIVTDLTGDGVTFHQALSLSADGSTLAFTNVATGTGPDTGDVYTLRNLDDILAAAPRAGTQISSLAPTLLKDENVFPIRTIESDNFAFLPCLSDNGSIVYFSEDWNNAYRGSDPVSALGSTDFDLMASYGDGTEATQRLTLEGSQAYATVTQSGSRIMYSQPMSGILRLFAAPIRVSTLASTGVSPWWVKSAADTSATPKAALGSTELQHFDSDGSAVLHVGREVTVSFPSASQKIYIETPVAAEAYSRLPLGADVMPFVRIIGPVATTFSGTGPVTIDLKYNDAQFTGIDEDSLLVYRLDTASNVYRPLDSTKVVHNKAANTFTATVSQLGTYGIGAPAFVDDDVDGMANRWELIYGLDPWDNSDTGGDADGDGLTTLQEYQNGGAPNMEDTDGDGYWDGMEFRLGTDMADPNDFPPLPSDGDLDRDGTPDAVDLQIVINGYLGKTIQCPADVNGDSLVNAADIQAVINAVLRNK